MKKHEVLVITTKALLPKAQLDYMRDLILKQKEEGVIVLPAWCEAQVVSGDVKIVVKEEEGFGDELKWPKTNPHIQPNEEAKDE